MQFPFMLINNVPLRHDHDRIQRGRTHHDALPVGAIGAIWMVEQSAVFAWYELLGT
jgi:hypothetical protein